MGFFMIFIVLFMPLYALSEERLSVLGKIVNIRSGPGTQYDVLWKVEKYYPVIILKKEKNWYNFKDFESDKGWIHKSFLGKLSSVITIKNKCNVRSGPGKEYAVLFTVENGVPFKKLGKKKSWIKVEHVDGDIGWIYQPLVW
ncbi:MAG: hypothetical protein B6I26_02790 [Desulfobacteraceae bacterium 4572_130]|nr:MAG: hypothetical protein B6I26_02790 [Desulfobacteraceae bacterium 4572_130]